MVGGRGAFLLFTYEDAFMRSIWVLPVGLYEQRVAVANEDAAVMRMTHDGSVLEA